MSRESFQKIKTVASEPAVDGEFARLTAEYAADDLQKFESYKAQARQKLTYSKESVEASQIVKAFDVLVNVSMPSPNAERRPSACYFIVQTPRAETSKLSTKTHGNM